MVHAAQRRRVRIGQRREHKVLSCQIDEFRTRSPDIGHLRVRPLILRLEHVVPGAIDSPRFGESGE